MFSAVCVGDNKALQDVIHVENGFIYCELKYKAKGESIIVHQDLIY